MVTSTIDEEKKEAEQYVKQLTDKMHEHHVRFLFLLMANLLLHVI